ncbi:MAG: DNA polymerase III subunit delta' [Zoogloea sp.]|uniref:DNA polymerase III subunit delta' n=1 Tax=Zoogloea sp. TaxID=49181 RepID=UPI003F2ECC29
MAGQVHPWQTALWQRALDRAGRLPHALLFAGPAGGGKRDFAEALAARLLCARPGPDGHACGQCESCQWRLAGNHPDLLRVIPAADQEERADEGADQERAKDKDKDKDKEKAASRQILIEQIRDLQQALTTGGHRGGGRVVILDPAEAMNPFTANALLKLLEEPTTQTTFLLISSHPRRLLPTIRSRCQTWTFPRPQAEAAHAWLAAQGNQDAPALLAFVGGMPLAAQALAEAGGAAQLQRFVTDIGGLPQRSALHLAGDWEAWIKGKEAQASGLTLATLADWLQRWVADLVSLRLGGPVRFFPTHQAALAALAQRLGVDGALACYNEVTQSRRVSQHPLNARLFLEDMLLRYARSLSRPAGSTVRK